MLERLDVAVGRWLSEVVRRVTERAAGLLALVGLSTGVVAVFVVLNAGLNMDHKTLLSPDLPFQRVANDFAKYFPSLDDALLIVVEGETPEMARGGARELAARLQERQDVFGDVYVPGANSFFLRNGLLYRTLDELEAFVDDLARFQPVVAALTRDASLARLTELIEIGLERANEDADGEAELSAILDRVGHATVQVFADYPIAVSWEDLMVAGSAVDPGTRWVVIAEPHLDFDALLPAAEPIAAIESAALALGLIPERGVQVRVTGNPALNHDEMMGLIWDVGVAGIASIFIVVLILWAALRSIRIAGAAAITLIIGLIWTAGFATVAVGKLNLLSVAFGVLFIGLGVDFAIHLGMYVVQDLAGGRPTAAALIAAAARVGTALVLCAATTAIGFLSFVPTPYFGVAQLGLIAGAGMVVIVVLTVTVFPALVVLFEGENPEHPGVLGAAAGASVAEWVRERPALIVATFAALSLGAIAVLPGLRFSSNVVEMRNPNTPSVEAFRDLLADRDRSPWSIDILTRDLEAGAETVRRVRQLPRVEMALTLQDYVPDEQEEKREILFDGALLLDTPRAVTLTEPTVDVAEQIAALRVLRDLTDDPSIRARRDALGKSVRRLNRHLDAFLTRIEDLPEPSAALAELEEVLLGGFQDQVVRLTNALEPEEVSLETLPAELRNRLLAPDGHARVQVFPRDDLSDTAALEAFVEEVQAVEPEATGVAVNILELGRATVASLRQALALALIAITGLLGILLHRSRDALLVLLPLVVAGLLTAGAMSLLGIAFNFANVVVLPLLLGIGVDSGIHLVRSWSKGGGTGASVLGTTAARAVFFSALTTMASFGTLALSPHLGVATLGQVLVIGLLLTLASNLVFLPALLALHDRRPG